MVQWQRQEYKETHGKTCNLSRVHVMDDQYISASYKNKNTRLFTDKDSHRHQRDVKWS